MPVLITLAPTATAELGVGCADLANRELHAESSFPARGRTYECRCRHCWLPAQGQSCTNGSRASLRATH
eukprot:4326689-Pyramimonas_sp.AAC.1